MKKRGMIVLVLAAILSLNGCGQGSENANENTSITEEQQKTAEITEKPETDDKLESTDDIEGIMEEPDLEVEMDDALSGYMSVERQIELFSQYKDEWAVDVEYADDIYSFTLADLNYDGKVELIVSNGGGTGAYTYSNFYNIDENGKLRKLETSFQEGDSQPDLIEDKMTVYSSFSKDVSQDYYIVYDMIKVSPACYVYRISSICLKDDFVLETPLASQTVTYEGEDNSANIVSEDCNGNALTEEEYDNFPDTYYSDMDLSKKTAIFKWEDVRQLADMGHEEVEALLEQTYSRFSTQDVAVLTEPPILKLQDTFSGNSDDVIILLTGNYEWNYWVDQANDEMSAGIACGMAPLDEAKDAERHTLPDYAEKTSNGVPYSVSAVVLPSSLTVREYFITELGDGEPEVLSKERYEDDFTMYLQPNRVYDITAEWDKDMLSVNGFYGVASYVLVTGE